jgi:L-histidine N-alpha-methyltransferase
VSSLANISIHPSQFPEAVRNDLLRSLRSRQINHKFHYDSFKQTRKWLALHQAYSPSRTDPDCAVTYDRSFEAVVAAMGLPTTWDRSRRYRDRRGRTKKSNVPARTPALPGAVHLIGLGCGGGQKDTRLLKLLRDSGHEVFYTPVDVSVAMVLVARQQALSVIPADHCSPLVCDLATADDLPAVIDAMSVPRAVRLVTCFGMLPNFEPQVLPALLANLLRRSRHSKQAPGLSDQLLLSANLAPGPDYAAGVQRVLPQYDNPLTRGWLMTFLFDLGIEGTAGEFSFAIEDDTSGDSQFRRIAANFRFTRSRTIELDAERVKFKAGNRFLLFFSYRHTSALVASMMNRFGLRVTDQWITQSGQEGVFAVRRR